MRSPWVHRFCSLLIALVVPLLLTIPGLTSVVRSPATSLIPSKRPKGIHVEWLSEKVGTRVIQSEVARIDPGASLPLPADGSTLTAKKFVALRRMAPLEWQMEPLSFAIRSGDDVLVEMHGIVDKGGPWDTAIVPVPSDLRPHGLTLVNTSSIPLFLAEVLYFNDVKIDPAMDLYFLAGGLGNESELTRSINLIPIDSAPGEGSRVGVAVNWPFLSTMSSRNVPADEIDMEIGFKRALKVASDRNLKLNVKLTSDWGGWPVHISDGLGGRFGDLEYQQVMFSPNHVRETSELDLLLGENNRREYGLTTPNRWSSTPWLTYNHPHLNAFLEAQYGTVARVFDRLYERWLLQRLDPGVAPLSTGNESLYWARENDRGMDDFVYSDHNDGVDRDPLWADFNPYVIAEAQKDGVDLDPFDGLDARERQWLHNNLARHNQSLVDAMRQAQGASVLTIRDGETLDPSIPPRDQIYTEPYGYPFYPLWDAARPMMNVGIVQGARPGTQWYTTEFIPYMRKQREFGITANPNFEWTGIAGVGDALASL